MNRLSTIAPLALLAAIPAAATVSFGTTASGTLAADSTNIYAEMSNGFNPNLPAWVWTTGGFEFTVPDEYTLDSLTVPIRTFNDVNVTFTLYSGGSQPNTILEASSQVVPTNSGFNFSLFTFDFSGNTLLEPGQNYFMVGTVPQSTTNTYEAQWAGNPNGVTVPFLYGETWLTGFYAPNGFLGWNSFSPVGGPAWQINAQQPVPEPAAFALAALGLFSMGLIRARKLGQK